MLCIPKLDRVADRDLIYFSVFLDRFWARKEMKTRKCSYITNYSFRQSSHKMLTDLKLEKFSDFMVIPSRFQVSLQKRYERKF